MDENKKELVADIVGSTIGGILGVTGVPGAILGAIISPAISQAVKWLISEFESNKFSKSEKENICHIISNVNPINKNNIVQLDYDWLSNYFGNACQAYSDELRFMWSKVLEAKINDADAISKGTLNILKNFSKEDFECFSRIVPYVLQSKRDEFVIPKIKAFNENIMFVDLLDLSEINLINSDMNLHYECEAVPQKRILFYNNDKCLTYSSVNENTKFNVGIVRLTKLGRELYRIFSIEYYENIFIDVIHETKEKNSNVRFEVCKVKRIDGDKIYLL